MVRGATVNTSSPQHYCKKPLTKSSINSEANKNHFQFILNNKKPPGNVGFSPAVTLHDSWKSWEQTWQYTLDVLWRRCGVARLDEVELANLRGSFWLGATKSPIFGENNYFLALYASFGTTDTTGNCPEVSVKSRYFTLLVQRFETQPRTALVAQLVLPSCL